MSYTFDPYFIRLKASCCIGIVALPIFPVVSGSTIVYGSEDGGITIHNSCNLFYSWMSKVATKYALAEHVVFEKKLYTGGDVEAHKVIDSNKNPHYCE